MQPSVVVLLASLCVATASPAFAGSDAADPAFRQSDEQFRAAVANDSTAPSFVFVTIVDGNTGQRSSGCLIAPFLLGAVDFEYGWDFSDASKAERFVLDSKDRVFAFKNPKALNNVRFEPTLSAEACSIIKRGQPAFRADITGEVVAGQP